MNLTSPKYLAVSAQHYQHGIDVDAAGQASQRLACVDEEAE